MAQATKIITVCDLHRGEALATSKFAIAIDGDKVALDVCDQHLREIRAKVKPWLTRAARGTATPTKTRRAVRATKATKSRPKRDPEAPLIRAWAAENGLDMPARGRIPTAVKQAYKQAHTAR